jgi:Protein of unknown function (DUF1549)/Protein of unknown function (DUF1553)
MARFLGNSGLKRQALGVALGLVAVVGISALGDESEGKGKAPQPEVQADKVPAVSRKDQREAREILKSLRDLNNSLKQEGKLARQANKAGKLPPRTTKTIKTPTLDSAAIDSMLEQNLSEAKVIPARLTTDEEFVRRVCLDVTGKLPTPEQLARFVRDHEKNKRGRLIDFLLDSPEYANNWARYWRDVIQYHAANTNLNQVRYPALEKWLAEQFAKNAPWDEIAGELITATGRNDENGAVVFTLAQMAQPVEMAGEVSRVFMGVQIQCAQCHDHPNDPWKREQFHEFAAFFAGTRSRRAGGQTVAQAKAKGVQPAFEVVAQGRPNYTMPDLKDPQKQIPVKPHFFLASKTEAVPESLSVNQRRTLVASYVTGQDNPWFAKAFVNRMWTSLMGEGFYNPVDDMGPTRAPNMPELLDALATQWQEGGYDIKWLFRTILNTKAYQRESRASNTAAGRTPFASNCPSRLRSDQILDALVQALNLPLDRAGGRGAALGKAAAKKAAGAGPLALRNNPRFAINLLFGVDPSIPSDDVLGTIPQALFLMNSQPINRAIQASNGTVLGEILSATPDDRQALEALYIRVLARRPNAKEVSTCGRYLETVGNRREAFEDILWSLINSTEFLSRR